MQQVTIAIQRSPKDKIGRVYAANGPDVLTRAVSLTRRHPQWCCAEVWQGLTLLSYALASRLTACPERPQ